MRTLVIVFFFMLATQAGFTRNRGGHHVFPQLSNHQEGQMAKETGTATGVLTIDGKPIDLKHAYAMLQPNAFEKEKNDIAILVTADPLPDGALDGVNALLDAVPSLRGWALFTLDEEHNVVEEVVDHPSLGERRISTSGRSYADFIAKRFGQDKIEGSFETTKPKNTFGHTYEIKVSFEAPIVQAKRAEPPPHASDSDALPADGGEPGKAFLAYVAAIHKRDLETVRGMTLADGQDFKDETMLDFAAMMTPKEPKFEKGHMKDERAVLFMSGTVEEEKTWGTIEMTRKDGKWFVANLKWSNTPPESK